ncbi:S-methyl-5'-thioadenosine phosphorylase [Frankia sp. AgB32]|uniref:S-methyl-5'-thioadenosine phosphorylase n=1 Tax=Frankia sp. AgB32 TaxID=631119 RepID=UPI00200F9AD5|nr:S-methyl-5'-thioadenosine phosphorylase [Frankia sp. AgB32]MCK9895080.1 S-methyl-5'-thioadenosine phosphorylase [Frankia sp. AgB32]
MASIPHATQDDRIELGVIGGTGLYSLFDNTKEVRVSTPYGEPSDVFTVAQIDGRFVAFLPRHGRGHEYPPSAINYRANMWALRALGVRQILAPCAVGSLLADQPPGTFVIPDQLIDRTSGRSQSYFETGAVHVSFADPYCPVGRSVLAKSADRLGLGIVNGGTMLVIEGPRFSTRAESRWYAAAGCSVINMTGYPEASLARELAMCYTTVALVTDFDAGVDQESSVSQPEVFRIFAENTDRLRVLLKETLPDLPVERDCPCVSVHEGIVLPINIPGASS